VGTVACFAIFCAACIALRERIDERLLARRSFRLERNRFLNCGERFRLARRIHRRIDVGPDCERFTPVSYSEIRIETFSLAIGAASLRVVEGVRKIKSMVDEELRMMILGRMWRFVVPMLLVT